MVIGPSEVIKNRYDLLVVDEAHRLKRRKGITNYKVFDDVNKHLGLDNHGNHIDWIIKNSKHQIFFYDSAQSIRPSDIPKKQFDALKKNSQTIKLESQMRVKGGVDYIKFVDNILNQRTTLLKKFESKSYDLKIYKNLTKMIEELEIMEKQHGLSRMVSGYSWEWISKNSNNPDVVIDDEELFWNKTSHDWINSTSNMREMGCIHTTQGYDLNYCGIIFGSEIIFNKKTNQIEVLGANYHDKNGKRGVNNDDIHSYIINIYKTLMYRGIKGTFIYCHDENLKNYFETYITKGHM